MVCDMGYFIIFYIQKSHPKNNILRMLHIVHVSQINNMIVHVNNVFNV